MLHSWLLEFPLFIEFATYFSKSQYILIPYSFTLMIV